MKKIYKLILPLFLIFFISILFSTCKVTGLGGSVDINKPEGAIKYPMSGDDPICSTFVVKGWATDDRKVQKIELLLENIETKEQLTPKDMHIKMEGPDSTGKVLWSITVKNDQEKDGTTLKYLDSRCLQPKFPIPDGSYKIIATITDSSGKDISVNETIKIDNTPPVLIVDTPFSTTKDPESILTQYGADLKVIGAAGDASTIEKLYLTGSTDNQFVQSDFEKQYVGSSINTVVTSDGKSGYDSLVENTTIKSKIFISDNARVYDGSGNSGEGNISLFYYVNNNELQTKVLGKGYTTNIIADYFAGKKGDPNGSDHQKKLASLYGDTDALDALKNEKIKSDDDTVYSTFSVDPAKSPGFKIPAFDLFPTDVGTLASNASTKYLSDQTYLIIDLVRNKDGDHILTNNDYTTFSNSGIKIRLYKSKSTSNELDNLKKLLECDIIDLNVDADGFTISGSGRVSLKTKLPPTLDTGYYRVVVDGKDSTNKDGHEFVPYDSSNKSATDSIFIMNLIPSGAGPFVFAPPPVGYKNSNFDIEATVQNISGGSAHYKIDDVADSSSTEITPNAGKYIANIDVSGLNDGEHTVHFYVKNSSNQENTYSVKFKLDKTVPEVPTLVAPETPSASNPVILDYYAIEFKGSTSDITSGIKSITCQTSTDGSTFEGSTLGTINSNNWSAIINLKAKENNFIKVIVEDNAGNTSEQIFGPYSVNSDSPVVTEAKVLLGTYEKADFANDSHALVNNSNVKFAIKANSAIESVGIESVIVKINGEDKATSLVSGIWTLDYDFTGSPGISDIEIIVTDNKKKVTRLNSKRIQLDNQLPTIAITTEYLSKVNKTIAIKGTASDNLGLKSVIVKYNDAVLETGVSNSNGKIASKAEFTGTSAYNWKFDLNTTKFPKGVYNFTVLTEDNAGNTATKSFTLDVDQDSDRPEVIIDNLDKLSGAYLISGKIVIGTIIDDDGIIQKVEIAENALFTTDVQTSTKNNWEYKFKDDVAEGQKTLYFRITDAKGTIFTVKNDPVSAEEKLLTPKMTAGSETDGYSPIMFVLDTTAPVMNNIFINDKADPQVFVRNISANNVIIKMDCQDTNGLSLIGVYDGATELAKLANPNTGVNELSITLPNGKYEFTIKVVDNSGREKIETRTVIVDHEAPILDESTTTLGGSHLDVISSKWISNGSLQVVGGVTDSVSGIDYAKYKFLDGSNNLISGSERSFNLSASGTIDEEIQVPAESKNLNIEVADRAGNLYTKTIPIKVDSKRPLQPVITQVNGVNTANPPIILVKSGENLTILGTCLDADSGINNVNFSLDTYSGNAIVTGNNWTINLPSDKLKQGDLKITSVDNVGLESDIKVVNIQLDSTPPTLNIDLPINNSKVNGSIDIGGTVSDDNLIISKVVIYAKTGNLNTQAEFAGVDPLDTITGIQGLWQYKNFDTTDYTDNSDLTIMVEAFDQAGNIARQFRTVNVDQNSDRPIIKIASIDSVSDAKLSGTRKITGSVEDDDGVVKNIYLKFGNGSFTEYELSGTMWTCDIPASIEDGVFTVDFKVIDATNKSFDSTLSDIRSPKILGNKDTSIISSGFNLTFDTKPPVIKAVKYTEGNIFTEPGNDLIANDVLGKAITLRVYAYDTSDIAKIMFTYGGRDVSVGAIQNGSYSGSPCKYVDVTLDLSTNVYEEGAKILKAIVEDSVGMQTEWRETVVVDKTAPEISQTSPDLTSIFYNKVTITGLVLDTLSGVNSKDIQYTFGNKPYYDSTSSIHEYVEAWKSTGSTWTLQGINLIKLKNDGIATGTGSDWNVTLKVKATDRAGNTSTATNYTIKFDPEGNTPNIQVLSPTDGQQMGMNVMFTGTATVENPSAGSSISAVTVKVAKNIDLTDSAIDVSNVKYNSSYWSGSLTQDQVNTFLGGSGTVTLYFQVIANAGTTFASSEVMSFTISNAVAQFEDLKMNGVDYSANSVWLKGNGSILTGKISHPSGIGGIPTITVADSPTVEQFDITNANTWFTKDVDSNYNINIPINTDSLKNKTGYIEFNINAKDASGTPVFVYQNIRLKYDNSVPSGIVGTSISEPMPSVFTNGTFTLITGTVATPYTNYRVLVDGSIYEIQNVNGKEITLKSASGLNGNKDYAIVRKRHILSGNYTLEGHGFDTGSGIEKIDATITVGDTNQNLVMTRSDISNYIRAARGNFYNYHGTIDTNILSNGAGTLTLKITDYAGNTDTITEDIQVKNTPLQIDRLTLTSDLNDNGLYNSIVTYKTNLTKISSDDDYYKGNENTCGKFTFKTHTSKILVNYSAGKFTTTSTAKYKLFIDDVEKLSGILSGATSGEIDIQYLLSDPNFKDGKYKFTIRLFDDSVGNIWYAEAVLDVEVYCTDKIAPVGYILPLYANLEEDDGASLDKKSSVIYNLKKALGHAEISSTTLMNGAYGNSYPAVSGKVRLTGIAYDNTLLKSISLMDIPGVNPTATYEGGTWTSSTGLNIKYDVINNSGHYITWEYIWDTERPQTGLAITLDVTDASSNKAENADSASNVGELTATQRATIQSAVVENAKLSIGQRIRFVKPDSESSYLVVINNIEGNTIYWSEINVPLDFKNIETYTDLLKDIPITERPTEFTIKVGNIAGFVVGQKLQLTNSTNTYEVVVNNVDNSTKQVSWSTQSVPVNATTVKKYVGINELIFNVNIVPYVTEIKRAKKYNTRRSSSGAWGVARSDKLQIIGFNLDEVGSIVKIRPLGATDIDVTGGIFTLPNTSKSGSMVLTVNGVRASNNLNNNARLYNKNINESKPETKYWVDDLKVNVWDDSNIFPGSTNPKYPAMAMGRSGDLYASFSNYSDSSVRFARLGDTQSQSVFKIFDPPEETDICVTDESTVNILFLANYQNGTNSWTSNYNNSGGIYCYDSKVSGTMHRFELLYHNQQLQQFKSLRIARGNNKYISICYYDTLSKSIKYSTVLNNAPDIYWANRATHERAWINLDGGKDIHDYYDYTGGTSYVLGSTGLNSINNDGFENGLHRLDATGNQCSIALDTNDYPIVLYGDVDAGTLRLARASSAIPKSKNNWKVQSVLADDDPNNGLVVDSLTAKFDSEGYLHIAFRNTRGQLCYIKSTNKNAGADQYTFATSQIIDEYGNWADLTLDGTIPYISYMSRINSYDGIRIAYLDSELVKSWNNDGTVKEKGAWHIMTAAMTNRADNVRTCIEVAPKSITTWKTAVGYTPGDEYRAVKLIE